MKALISASLAAACFLAVGCPPTPPPNPPPTPDASDASTLGDAPTGPCADACAALKRVGCELTGCFSFMSDVEASKQVRNEATKQPLTCAAVAAVHTKADALKLGFACP